MVACALRTCTSRTGIHKNKKSTGVTFHRFPRRSCSRRLDWIAFTARVGWEPTEYSTICSKHFEEKYFDKTSACGLIRLRDNAVPTLLGLNQNVHATAFIMDAISSAPSSVPSSSLSSVFLSSSSCVVEPRFSPPKVHWCSQCPYESEWQFQLDRHVLRAHGIPYRTNLYDAVTEPEQFSCVCGNFQTCHKLGMHEHWKHQHDPAFATDQSTELNAFHDQFCNYRCDFCEYRSHSGIINAKHTASCFALSAGIRCTECSYRTDRTWNLRRHMLMHVTTKADERTDNYWFQCIQCSYKSRHEGLLQTHLLQHIGAANEFDPEKHLQCSECSFRCKFKSFLKRHMLKHIPSEAVEWSECPQCPYKTKHGKNHLKKHMLRHTPVEEIEWFACDKCPYKAKYKNNLTEHQLTHASSEEIAWFACSQCSYRAKRSGELKRHVVKHTPAEEIQWLECTQCPYKAKQKRYMKMHMLKHADSEEVAWFECQQCEYKSRRRVDFLRHMVGHMPAEEIAWFACTQCSYKCKQKRYLKTHMLTHGVQGNK